MTAPKNNLRNNLLRSALQTGFTYCPAACMAAVAVVSSASGATVYWDTNDVATGSGNAGGIWSLVDNNWTTDPLGETTASLFANGDDVVFSAGTDGIGAWTVNISGTVEPSSITFEELGEKTIAGGTINFASGGLIDSSALGTNNVDLFVNSNITGTGGLTIAAHGDATSNNGGSNGAEFELLGNNTFTGGFTVTSGVVVWDEDASFGDPANGITLDGGGILWNQGSSTTLSRDIALGAAGGTIRLYGGANELTHTGVLTGSTTLRRTDGGRLNLSGNGSGFTGTFLNGGGDTYFQSSDWSGTAIDAQGGRVFFDVAGTASVASLETGRDIHITAGTVLDVTSGTVQFKDGAGFWMQNAGTITSSSGTLNVLGGTIDDGGLTTAVHAIRTIIADGGSPLSLVKDNNNSLILDKANTYTGGTTINGGRVQFETAGTLGTGDVSITDGGQLFLTSSQVNNATIAGNGVSEGAGQLGAIRFANTSLTGNLTVDAAGSRIVGYTGASGEVIGDLLGSGNLEVNIGGNALANGEITLTGSASAYTGTITVSGGTFNVGDLGGGITAGIGTANLSGSVTGTVTLDSGTINLASGANITTPVIASGGILNIGSGSTVTGNVVTAFGAGTDVLLDGSITGDLVIDDGSTLDLGGGSAGSLSLGFDGSSVISLAATAPAAISGDVTVRGTQEVTLNTIPAPGSPATIFTYTGSASDPIDADGIANNFVIASGGGSFRSITFTDTGTALTADLGAESSAWVGGDVTNPSFWDAVTTNWSSTDNLFFDGDSVTFDDTATSFTVAMQSNVAPFAVVVNNSANPYSITGAGVGIVGTAGITKQGSDSLLLGGDNTFSGAIDVQDGTVSLGSQLGFGATSGITVASGAQVNLNGQSPGAVASGRYAWTIEGDGGDGVGGEGAITNTGGASFGNSGVLDLTLSGNAEIGGNNGRFDVGLYGGSIDGGGFTLNKVGSNQMVFRAPATDITYVVDAGEVTFEDFDTSSGTNPIVVNGGVLGTFGNRTITNDVSLADGTALINRGSTGTWTGNISVAGNTTIGQFNNPIILQGELSGSGLITKGAGNLTLANADNSGFTGKWLLDANTIIVENDLSFGAVPASPTADALTMDDVRIQNNSASLTLAANRGITATNLAYFNPNTGGTMTVNGPIVASSSIIKDNNNGTLVFNGPVTSDGNIQLRGGSTTFNGDLTAADAINGTLDLDNGNNLTFGSGSTSQVRFSSLKNTTLNIGPGATFTTEGVRTSDQNGRVTVINQTGGTLNITGSNNSNNTSASFLMGHWGGGSSSAFNLSGGTLNAPDAQLSLGWDSSNVTFTQTGGEANLKGIDLGNGRGNPATFNLNAGVLNLGSDGITTQGNKTVNFAGGTVGANASWSTNQPINLTGGDVTFDPSGNEITLGGVLAGVGGIVQDGAGSLVINSGGNTFAGSVTATNGTVAGSGLVGDVTVGALGSIGAGSSAASGFAGTFSTGALQVDGDVTLDLDATGLGTSDLIAVTGDLTFGAGSTISPRFFGAAFPGSTVDYTLMTYSGALTGTPTIDPQFFADFRTPVTNLDLGVTTPGEVNLEVTFNSADIEWSSLAADYTWDVNNTVSWNLLGSLAAPDEKYFQADNVFFTDDSANGSPITLVGALAPGLISMDSDNDFTFTGAGQIAGTASLTKGGTGTLTLLTNNTYTGATDILDGAVVVGNGGTVGALGGTGDITIGATASLSLDRSDAISIRRMIGGGLVSFDGGNVTTTQAGNNVDFLVNSGTFFARGGGFSSGLAPSRLITVKAGATLDTVTHSMGSSVGGGGDVPDVFLDGGTWFLNNEQYMGALTMTGGLTTGPGEIRALGGGEYLVTATATGSEMGARINMFAAKTFRVEDGAAATDLLVSGRIYSGGGVSKFGAGRMALTGDNGFTGGLSVEEGILSAASVADAGGVASIGTGFLGVNEGSTFEYTGTGAETTTRQLWIDRGAGGTIDIVDAGATVTFTPSGGSRVAPVEKTGAGTMVLNGVISGAATLTVSEGAMVLGSTNTYTGDTTVANGATLSLGTTGSIESSTLVNIEDGGTMNVAGLLSPFSVGTGQTLGGEGTVQGNIADATGGSIAPGDGIGTLDVSGNATLGAGTLAIELDDATTPTADTLDVTGALNITGATLDVTELGAAAGTEYIIANYGSLTGTFASVTPGWTVDYSFGGGNQIAILPAPADPYDAWETDNGIAGAGRDVDSDGDGVDNGIEFVIGGDPNGADSNSLLPTATVDATNLVFVFRRTDDSAGENVYVEYGSDLAGWAEAQAGEPVGPNPVTILEEDDAIAVGIDRVTVTIPRALFGATSTGFARLVNEAPVVVE